MVYVIVLSVLAGLNLQRVFALSFVLSGTSGCEANYSVLEPPSDGDIRILLTHNALETKSTVAHAQQPLRYDLSKAFAANQTTQVWLFSYRRETLTSAFPLLADFSNEEIADLIQPQNRTDEGFDAPVADSVYQLDEVSSSSSNIYYAPRTWTRWLQVTKDTPKLGFRFRFDPKLGCPWGPNTLRFFRIDQVYKVCSVARDAFCRWQIEDCSSDIQEGLCAALSDDRPPVQVASGQLRIGDLECASMNIDAKTLGLQNAWSCQAGICADERVELGIQEDPALDPISSKPWTASHQTAHQSLFPSSWSVYASQENTVIAAYHDDGQQVKLRSYRWIRDQGSEDALEQQDLVLPSAASILKKDYIQMSSLKIKEDLSLLILNGKNISYIIDNQSSDSAPFILQAPRILRHSEIENRADRLSDQAELVASGVESRRLYGVSDHGLVIFDVDSLKPVFSTSVSAGLDFSGSRQHIMIGKFQGEERILVCPIHLLNFSTDTCGPKIYIFDTTAKLIDEKQLPGPLRTVIDGYEAIFSYGNFVLGQCALSDSDCENNMQIYYAPPRPSASVTAPQKLGVFFNSWSQTRDSKSAHPVLAISYSDHVGVLDLSSGLSTATRVAGQSRFRLLSIISNDIETENWLLVQESSKVNPPQWIHVPTHRAP